MWGIAPCAAAVLGTLGLMCPAGLEFTLRHSPTAQKYLVETMTGGVALLDYDGDGRLDIFLVNGGKLTDPVELPARFSRHEPAYRNRLFRQQADGSFTDVTEAAKLERPGEANYGMGVAVGDYNNDGRPDLYVTNFGSNQLFRNNGDGTFTDVTLEAGVGGGGWSVSAGFFDFDNDGFLDLYVSRYLDWDFDRNRPCGKPFRTYCRPDYYEGAPDILYRNLGDGRFEDVSQASGIGKLAGKGMGLAFLDYDLDGLVDVFVANDGMEQYLFRNLGGGRFRETGLEAGVALSGDGRSFAGMGVAAGDFDNDGKPDLLVTNLALEHWALYRNLGGGLFRYASLETGVAALSAPSSGWGAGFRDFDNDGWKDLFAARSHVLDNVERVQAGLRYREPAALWRNRSGRFEAAEPRDLPAVAGRGAAFGDLNNDGTMDVVVNVLGEAPQVVLNRPNGNHWLILRLIGTRSNRDGAGARVRAGSQTVEVTTAGSYLAASDPRVHFGLGTAGSVDVEIVWPSGVQQRLAGVAANQILEVREP